MENFGVVTRDGVPATVRTEDGCFVFETQAGATYELVCQA